MLGQYLECETKRPIAELKLAAWDGFPSAAMAVTIRARRSTPDKSTACRGRRIRGISSALPNAFASLKKTQQALDNPVRRVTLDDAVAVNVEFKYRVRGVRPGASELLPLATQSRLRSADLSGWPPRHHLFLRAPCPLIFARNPLITGVRPSQSIRLPEFITVGQDGEVAIILGLVRDWPDRERSLSRRRLFSHRNAFGDVSLDQVCALLGRKLCVVFRSPGE